MRVFIRVLKVHGKSTQKAGAELKDGAMGVTGDQFPPKTPDDTPSAAQCKRFVGTWYPDRRKIIILYITGKFAAIQMMHLDQLLIDFQSISR